MFQYVMFFCLLVTGMNRKVSLSKSEFAKFSHFLLMSSCVKFDGHLSTTEMLAMHASPVQFFSSTDLQIDVDLLD